MNSCTASVVLPVCQGCPPKLCVQELCRPGQKQQMVQVKGACEWKNIRSCTQFRMFFVHDLGVAPYQEIPWNCVIQQMSQLVFCVFFQFTSLFFGTTSSKWLRQKWTNLSALGLMMKAAKLGGLWTRKNFLDIFRLRCCWSIKELFWLLTFQSAGHSPRKLALPLIQEFLHLLEYDKAKLYICCISSSPFHPNIVYRNLNHNLQSYQTCKIKANINYWTK